MTASTTRRSQAPAPPILRDLVFRNLRSSECVLIWEKDERFARDFEKRLVSAQPYLLEPRAIQVLQHFLTKLGAEDFYTAIASMRLPYEEVWLEGDIQTDAGGRHRFGMLVSQSTEGLRCLISSAFWFGDQKIWYPMHAGTAVTFASDGRVIYEDTPVAHLYDVVQEGREPEVDQTGRSRTAPVSGDTITERHAKDLGNAIQIAGLLAAFCGLMNKREVLEVDPLREPPRQQQRLYARDKLPAPKFGVARVDLARLGRLQQRAIIEDTVEELDSDAAYPGPRRAAHWVRGHLFLTRNGKLVWRRPHVRGAGEAHRRLIVVEASDMAP
ncbi:hypothetical protein D3P06_06855 [Paracoccus aestuarii]|uniref:Uncharacterized protein n=1 Tax=Paracoccus aestuarii TaxID=453842 RepID=A0A418ZY90_9RHOB|nr:hypothetical protein [Paracoccus aestuarii]RJL05461.1 hypothetical protein D3P06_06855 [Paracoccus aestuarii]WCR01296.1 hypothetical protein JHW48_17870 [Paracoccus aestuarii]